MEVTVLAVAMIVFAVALVAVGLAGLTERLPRNRWVGIRVPSIQTSDDAWRAGHHAASGAIIAAAGPPLLLAVAMIASPPAEVEDWLLAYIVVGVVTGGLIAMAVRQADRAAKEVASDG